MITSYRSNKNFIFKMNSMNFVDHNKWVGYGVKSVFKINK